MFPKAVYMEGVGGGGVGVQPHGSNNSFADDKAPGDLIP